MHLNYKLSIEKKEDACLTYTYVTSCWIISMSASAYKWMNLKRHHNFWDWTSTCTSIQFSSPLVRYNFTNLSANLLPCSASRTTSCNSLSKNSGCFISPSGLPSSTNRFLDVLGEKRTVEILQSMSVKYPSRANRMRLGDYSCEHFPNLTRSCI